jgi:hypothetical protein
MTGPISRGYLEGDERIFVDDSQTPMFQGTGTEDFFNAGWYFSGGLFTLPTHGNTAHFSDSANDYTAAYRLFIADAIPFRKHIRVGIEHGGVNDVSETISALAYYYYKPNNLAVLTDQLDVGNTASESAHFYTISNQTWSGSEAFQYEGNDLYQVSITDDGRAHQGFSQFTMSLQPTNSGAILRRRFDQGIANQQAGVFVDGAFAGVWYQAGNNWSYRWRDDDFMIPAAYTAGKHSITVQIQFLSSAIDWNEFYYSLYTVLPVVASGGLFPMTQSPGGITAGNATLRGMILPNLPGTAAWFDWGTNAGYGNQSAATTNVGNGFQVAPVTVTISNLVAGGIYR